MNNKDYFKAKTKENKKTIVVLSILSLIISIIVILFAGFSKLFLDSIDTDDFYKYLIILIALVCMEVIFKIVNSYYLNKKVNNNEAKIKKECFKNVLNKDYLEVKKISDSNLLSYITSDSRIIADSVITIIPSFITYISKIVLAVILLFFIDKIFALILLGGGILTFLITKLLRKKNYKLHKEVQEKEAKNLEFYNESIINLLVLKIFNNKNKLLEDENKINDDLIKTRNKKYNYNLFINGGFLIVMRASYLFAIVYVALNINKGVTIGSLLAFIQLISQIEIPFTNLSGLMPKYYSCLSSIDRLLNLMNKKEENKKVSLDTFNCIDINNVTFKYKDEVIINDFSYKINKNDFIVIKGKSGSGKSTLTKLIMGVFTPNEGTIKVDDYDISEINNLFSYVPQGNMMLSMSVRDNLMLFNDKVSDTDIINALKIVSLDSFIDRLDSNIFNLNNGLSEGELQRLSIARALLSNNEILVLDEATSALDKDTEINLLTKLKELNKTIIFITHKDIGISFASSIINIKR